MEVHVFRVASHETGERLDRYLTEKMPAITRSQIQRLIVQEKIKVNGYPAKSSTKINLNDHIRIEIPEPRETVLKAENLPLAILYEDGDLIVINKEAGSVVHPGAGHKKGTLVNALLYHCKHLSSIGAGIGGVLRPGVVHRLDKDTSGVMVFAKSDRAHQGLAKQFKERSIQRYYKALVFGKFQQTAGTFSDPIGRHPVQRKKMSTRSRHGKPALTRWKTIQSFDQMTLVEAILATGRTHQIRVHFSAAGHPVVGDSTYGGTRRIQGIVNVRLRRAIQKLPALLLHAAYLAFTHPVSGKRLSYELPLPQRFQTILAILNE